MITTNFCYMLCQLWVDSLYFFKVKDWRLDISSKDRSESSKQTDAASQRAEAHNEVMAAQKDPVSP